MTHEPVNEFVDWATPDEPRLSAAQEAMLQAVQRDGVRVYNGRAWRTVKALEARGLVVATWDLAPRADGRHAWKVTVRPRG